jgi:hypothetical protein
MDEPKKGAGKRFPLALPPDLDREVREWAQGDARRAPSNLNSTIVHLVRVGLKAMREQAEKEKGQLAAQQLAA